MSAIGGWQRDPGSAVQHIILRGVRDDGPESMKPRAKSIRQELDARIKYEHDVVMPGPGTPFRALAGALTAWL